MPITSRSFALNPVVQNIIDHRVNFAKELSLVLTEGVIRGSWNLRIGENGGESHQYVEDPDVKSLVKILNEANPYSYRCDRNPTADDWIVGVQLERTVYDGDEETQRWLDSFSGMCCGELEGTIYGVSYQDLLLDALTDRANAPVEALTAEGKYPKSDVAINKTKVLIERFINGRLNRAEELMVADIIARHFNQELDAALMQGEALNGSPSDADAEEMMNNQFMERVSLYADQLSEKKYANSQFVITAGPKA